MRRGGGGGGGVWWCVVVNFLALFSSLRITFQLLGENKEALPSPGSSNEKNMFTPKLCCTRHKTAPLTFFFFITICFFSLLFLFLLILLLLFLSFPPQLPPSPTAPTVFHPRWLEKPSVRSSLPPTHPLRLLLFPLSSPPVAFP